jgi:phage gpG-like protein
LGGPATQAGLAAETAAITKVVTKRQFASDMPEKITINGFTYDWHLLKERFDTVRTRLPREMAVVARNYFVDSFRRQGWYEGRTLNRWKPRKGFKDRGRAILVKSGRLRRSIRIRRAEFSDIRIATDAPYAAAHNFGFKGIVHVRQHTRRRYAFTREKYTTRSGKSRSRIKRIEAGSYSVRSHTRRMNLPQRQFMGDTELLNKKLLALADRAVDSIFR